MTTGERIKFLRINSCMSQAELARRANISKQTLWKYEHGVVKAIPLKNIEAIARELGCTPGSLVGWA